MNAPIQCLLHHRAHVSNWSSATVASRVAAFVGCLLATNVSAAQQSGDTERLPSESNRDERGVHEHDGFLLRLALGFGYEGMSIDNTTISGPGAMFALALGGMVASNLALNADLFGSAVVSPSVSIGGVDDPEAADRSVGLSGLGVGVTYFFMPINLYLAGSLGVGSARMISEGTDYESDYGFATNLMVGKEFWVSDNWGVGFAGQFLYCAVPRGGSDETQPYTAFNLLFSATYN